MQSPDAMASGAESAHTTTAITATAARHTRMTPVLYHAQLGPIVVMRRPSVAWRGGLIHHPQHPDRKSTRLNSSHTVISYAVFCLKKKKKKNSKNKHKTKKTYK